jgi:hypothetical protein
MSELFCAILVEFSVIEFLFSSILFVFSSIFAESPWYLRVLEPGLKGLERYR